MNCLGNPKEHFEGKRFRKGLVIGDVQSGKTATYSGLICKAADAGYKVVILLAGITESLRQQTQERIDESIVGITYKKVGKQVVSNKIGVGKDNKFGHPNEGVLERLSKFTNKIYRTDISGEIQIKWNGKKLLTLCLF